MITADAAEIEDAIRLIVVTLNPERTPFIL